MATKLTLSADKDTIRRAKRLAAERKTSVSALFANWVRAIDRKDANPASIGPLTRQATGLAKVPPNKTDRQLIEEALAEKYGI
jgi:hypothetical protein